MDVFEKILSVALGVYFIASMIPSAYEYFFTVDTTNWTAVVVALWGVTGIVIGAVVVRMILKLGK